MTECLKNAASDAVTRRTGTVKAVIETVFRRHQLACTVRVTEAAADPDAQYREIAPWNGKRATGAMGSRMVRRFP